MSDESWLIELRAMREQRDALAAALRQCLDAMWHAEQFVGWEPPSEARVNECCALADEAARRALEGVP